MGMDTPENKGNTPLIIATRAKQENIVDVLLKQGADRDTTNQFGERRWMLRKIKDSPS
jgi:ankyrin repeat protein